ncbi:alpha/beta hydrolase [Natranaerovirga hydrolytica]|uniref:alpha/beta hydrolase n=1 Tax=Natranaerovirga hydrolytica TaxID=680378 RepID=UPI001050A1C0|nr:hypothetical protein [Natranaerovirga hydrolytica]
MLVLTGCTNNNIQDTPTILAETNDAEQESSDVDSSQEEAKSEENGMVTLTIDPNLEGRTGTTISYSVGSEIDLSSRRYFFTREGYNRDLTLYFDADGQEMIPDNKFVIEEDTTVYLGWTKWSDDELPRINEYLTLLDESKKILTRPKAWNGDVDAFNAYAEFMDSTNIINAQGRLQVIDNPGIIDEMNEYRNKLVQTTSDVDEDVWYIWGDDMPDGTNPENFYLTHDSEDFTPFLVPYLAEDQSEVKGNMIVIAGGAFHRRANLHESYPAAEFYQNNGYNAFVLQYRVEPYSQLESFADLQRAIRYIKYNGENLGLAFPERVSAVGFSAGGMTISGMIDKLESDSLPSDYFNNYTPDEIDQVNSSLDAALNIYGAMEDDIKDPETKELPEMFFVVSEKDTTIPVESSISMYMDVFRLTRSELHLFADGIHGIGLGSTWNHGTYTAYSQWGDLSLTFLDITYGYQEKHIEN